jgi:hypothetical protein
VSYSTLEKSVFKMMILWKNYLIIAKDVWIIHVNFTVIPITFSEKKTGGITFTPHLVLISHKNITATTL